MIIRLDTVITHTMLSSPRSLLGSLVRGAPLSMINPLDERHISCTAGAARESTIEVVKGNGDDSPNRYEWAHIPLLPRRDEIGPPCPIFFYLKRKYQKKQEVKVPRHASRI